MGNIRRLARELLNPTKKMEEVLTVLKKDYNIKPAQKSASKEEIKIRFAKTCRTCKPCPHKSVSKEESR